MKITNREVAAFALALLAGAQSVAAQDSYTPKAPSSILGSRLIDAPTPVTVGARRWELLFAHRFRGTINHGGDSHDLWGLDGGADVTLGATYGLSRWLDVSLHRASLQEDFELALKAALWQESAGHPLSLAARAGVDRLQRRGAIDPTRPFVQLAVSRSLGTRVTLLASPSWISDTPRLENAFNVPFGISVRVAPDARFELEIVPENGDLDESVTAWHAGFSKTVGGHLFKVFLGNSRATTVDQMIGGDSDASFRSGDLRLGFNLVRYLPR